MAGECHDQKRTLSFDKLEAFIALEFARGIYGKAHSPDFLWNKLYGPDIFKSTMSRSDYSEMKKYLQFNN